MTRYWFPIRAIATSTRKSRSSLYFESMLTHARWLGDPARVLLSKAVIHEILKNNLVEQVVRDLAVSCINGFFLTKSRLALVLFCTRNLKGWPPSIPNMCKISAERAKGRCHRLWDRQVKGVDSFLAELTSLSIPKIPLSWWLV